MSSNTLIIILSGLVIFSYLFDQFAKKSRIPSVLLLLGLGIGLHYATDYLQIKTVDFLRVLPMLGTIGLIMIVLEGALELEYHSSKRKVILKSFASALGLLVFTTGVITVLINYVTHASLDNCVLNAIPLSVISSAIAIPSVANLTGENREFIIYESTFSDILGIIFFNFMLNNSHPTPGAVMGLGGEILLTIAVSLGACLLLIFLLRKISHHIKFFLIIAVMILLYGIGKHFHLSSLILVLVFGLFLTNIDKQRNIYCCTCFYSCIIPCCC